MTTLATLVVKIVGDVSDYSESLNKSREMTESFSGRAVSGLSALGGTIVMGALAGAAVAGTAVGLAVWNSAETIDQAYDKIQASTGATGETLRTLQGDFDTVFASVPTDAGTAADVIAALNQKLGLTGPALDGASIKLLNMTELLGGDAKTNAALFGRTMQDAGVPVDQAGTLLDKLFVASQKSGIGVDTLMQSLVQFGAPMRNMGFDLDTSIALFAKWSKEGVNAELVMGSLRIAAGNFAEAGKPLNEGLAETIEKIKSAKDNSEALTIAQGIFGSRAAGDMAAAIREGRFDIDDMTAALQGADGAINNTTSSTEDWNEKWVKFTNFLTISLAPMGQTLRDIAGDAMDMLQAFLSKPEVQAFIQDMATNVASFGGTAKEWLPKFAGWFQQGFGWLNENRGVIVAALAMIGVAILAFAYTSLAAAIPVTIAFVVAWWPVILVLGLVGVAAYLLYQAWVTNFGGIQDKFAVFMVSWNKGIVGWTNFGAGFAIKWDEGIRGWTGFFVGVGGEWHKFQIKWDAGIADWKLFLDGFDTKWEEGLAGWGNFFSGIGRGLHSAIDDAVEWLHNLQSALDDLKLPDWLTPGSPTPWEIGLLGIGGALEGLANTHLPALNAQLRLQPAGVLGAGTGDPRLMGRSGTNTPGGGAGGAAGVSVNVYLDHHPTVSARDEQELAELLGPAILAKLRQYNVKLG